MRLGPSFPCLLLLLALLFNVLEANKLSLGEGPDEYHKFCRKIFGSHNLTRSIVNGMTTAVMNGIELHCLHKPIHPLIPKTFSESLLCGDSLLVAMNKVIEILFAQTVRMCYDKPGFVGYYVLTTAHNEVDEESKRVRG